MKIKNTLLQISRYGMGEGDEALGLQLLVNYLKLIDSEHKLPQFIALYNGGVKLICEGSPAIDALQAIEQKGVKIIACKTCLNHFGLLEQVKVGMVGTMADIIELQHVADKVVSL